MASDTERKQYVYFGGKQVEFLKQATIFGKPYYDIVINGVKKTVPASMCTTEPNEPKQEIKKEKGNK